MLFTSLSLFLHLIGFFSRFFARFFWLKLMLSGVYAETVYSRPFLFGGFSVAYSDIYEFFCGVVELCSVLLKSR